MVVRSDGKSWSKKYRQGADGNASAAEEFLKCLQAEEAKIRKELETQAKIMIGTEEMESFKKAANCWICDKRLVIPEYLSGPGAQVLPLEVLDV